MFANAARAWPEFPWLTMVVCLAIFAGCIGWMVVDAHRAGRAAPKRGRR